MYYEDEDLSDFLRYALFFAQMADAEDPSTVKALLKSVTVPSVSFGIKREPFRTRYLVSAYLGGGFASTGSNQFAIRASGGVQLRAGGADPFGKRGFDVHMQVFRLRVPLKFSGRDFLLNFAQSLLDLGKILAVYDFGFNESSSVGDRASDIVPEQTPIERSGFAVTLRHIGGRAIESSFTHCSNSWTYFE